MLRKVCKDLKIQVLVAALNKDCRKLVEHLNIQTDTIIGNQCNCNLIEEFLYGKCLIKCLNFDERGTALNRNNALLRADGDVCLFSDDDMKYVNGYAKLVASAFNKYCDADVIVFNLIEKNPTRYIIKKAHRVHFYNFMRYGTARIAVRLDSIRKNGVFFNVGFGGGSAHKYGEDSLFLADCLKKRLKVYAVPVFIAELTEERESTCFYGYNKAYFFDKGYLFRTMTKKYWRFLCFQDLLRHCNLYRECGMKKHEIYKTMIKGGNSF